MTTPKTPKPATPFRLPDPPEREPDEVTAYDYVYKLGNARYLALHFGNPGTTLVEADHWIVASPAEYRTRARRPDLLIAFGVTRPPTRPTTATSSPSRATPRISSWK